VDWIDGDTSRFGLHICDRGVKGYAVLLIPDIQKSIDRWKLARMIYHEEIITDTEFQVLYKTLGAQCPKPEAYNTIKDKIGDALHVGFIDPKNDMERAKEDHGVVKVVGPFKVFKEETPQSKAHFDLKLMRLHKRLWIVMILGLGKYTGRQLR